MQSTLLSTSHVTNPIKPVTLPLGAARPAGAVLLAPDRRPAGRRRVGADVDAGPGPRGRRQAHRQHHGHRTPHPALLLPGGQSGLPYLN